MHWNRQVLGVVSVAKASVASFLANLVPISVLVRLHDTDCAD